MRSDQQGHKLPLNSLGRLGKARQGCPLSGQVRKGKTGSFALF